MGQVVVLLLVISEHCAFKHILSIPWPLAILTMIEVKTLSKKLIFVHLITVTMKTALYEIKFKKALNRGKLVRINNTISQSLLFTQWSIRFTSRYNVTLFLSISMIFLHSSAIACSSSDKNFTCAGFTVKLPKKCSYRSRLKTKEYGKHDSTKELRNKETMSNVKLQVIIICYILDLNELR